MCEGLSLWKLQCIKVGKESSGQDSLPDLTSFVWLLYFMGLAAGVATSSRWLIPGPQWKSQITACLVGDRESISIPTPSRFPPSTLQTSGSKKIEGLPQTPIALL